jgi:hypothetical protein
MAENLEFPSGNNFSIQDTMEMGMGSAELLRDLLAPETSTANVDELQDIIKPAETPKKEEDKPRGKEIVPKEEGKEPTPQDILKNFLGDAEEEKEQIEESVKSPEPKEEDEVSPFTTLSKELFKLGVFTKDEDENEPNISTPEEFRDQFIAEKQKGAIEVVNNFIGQFGEDYQQAFEAIYVKGVNPKDYFSVYNTITNFASLDLSKEENQVAVVRQALTDQGLESEDVDAEIDQAKNYGDLESKATKYHKVLVKKEALKLQQMEQKAEHELQQKTSLRNQYIQNVQQIVQDKLKNKEFDGIPLNPKLANELQDFLLTDKYKTTSGETLTDFDRTILELKRPENHAMKVKVALLLKILEKDPTLSTIQRSAVTKKSDQLFEEVARQVVKTRPVNLQQKPNSWFQ